MCHVQNKISLTFLVNFTQKLQFSGRNAKYENKISERKQEEKTFKFAVVHEAKDFGAKKHNV